MSSSFKSEISFELNTSSLFAISSSILFVSKLFVVFDISNAMSGLLYVVVFVTTLLLDISLLISLE